MKKRFILPLYLFAFVFFFDSNLFAQRFDPETGHYYMRNRYYSPETGRFISPDPLGNYAHGQGNSKSAFGEDSWNMGDPMGLKYMSFCACLKVLSDNNALAVYRNSLIEKRDEYIKHQENYLNSRMGAQNRIKALKAERTNIQLMAQAGLNLDEARLAEIASLVQQEEDQVTSSNRAMQQIAAPLQALNFEIGDTKPKADRLLKDALWCLGKYRERIQEFNSRPPLDLTQDNSDLIMSP